MDFRFCGNDIKSNLLGQPHKNHGISEFIRALKSFSTRRINELGKSKYPEIRQSCFYEHIIRDEIALNRIRKYIRNNPVYKERELSGKKFFSDNYNMI